MTDQIFSVSAANPGAEAGDLSGWTPDDAGHWSAASDPVSGSYAFATQGSESGDFTLSQTVAPPDLSGVSDDSYDVRLTVSAQTKGNGHIGLDPTTYAAQSITVQFLDGSDNVIDSFAAARAANEAYGKLTATSLASQKASLMAAASIKVILTGSHDPDNSYQAFFDDVEVVVTANDGSGSATNTPSPQSPPDGSLLTGDSFDIPLTNPDAEAGDGAPWLATGGVDVAGNPAPVTTISPHGGTYAFTIHTSEQSSASVLRYRQTIQGSLPQELIDAVSNRYAFLSLSANVAIPGNTNVSNYPDPQIRFALKYRDGESGDGRGVWASYFEYCKDGESYYHVQAYDSDNFARGTVQPFDIGATIANGAPMFVEFEGRNQNYSWNPPLFDDFSAKVLVANERSDIRGGGTNALCRIQFGAPKDHESVNELRLVAGETSDVTLRAAYIPTVSSGSDYDNVVISDEVSGITEGEDIVLTFQDPVTFPTDPFVELDHTLLVFADGALTLGTDIRRVTNAAFYDDYTQLTTGDDQSAVTYARLGNNDVDAIIKANQLVDTGETIVQESYRRPFMLKIPGKDQVSGIGYRPTITLKGANPYAMTVGGAYSDPGYTVSDSVDSPDGLNVDVDDSDLDTGTAGSYSVLYTVTNSAGLSDSATRSVNVNANDAPTITLSGANPLVLTVGDTYSDPGYSAADNEDGDLTSSVTVGGDTVDTSAAGTYTVTYSVTDSGGKTATASREVMVQNPAISNAMLGAVATPLLFM